MGVHLQITECMVGNGAHVSGYTIERSKRSSIVSGGLRMSTGKELIASVHEKYQILSREDDMKYRT